MIKIKLSDINRLKKGIEKMNGTGLIKHNIIGGHGYGGDNGYWPEGHVFATPTFELDICLELQMGDIEGTKIENHTTRNMEEMDLLADMLNVLLKKGLNEKV